MKIKKKYFQKIFLICAALHDSSPLFDSIILIILIYIYLLIFQVLYLDIVNNFLFIYEHMVLDLFNYMYS
jgi:hypothetical protein